MCKNMVLAYKDYKGISLLIYSRHPSIQIIVMLIGTKNEIYEPLIVLLAGIDSIFHPTAGYHCPRWKILIITFPEGSTDLKP